MHDKKMEPSDLRQLHQELRQQFGSLYDQVMNLLRQHDPLSLLEAGVPNDEYEPELGTILPRLAETHEPRDVMRVVHEEFVRWFDADIAGHRSDYQALGQDIWQVYEGWKTASR